MSKETVRRVYDESWSGYISRGKVNVETTELGRGIAAMIGPGKKVLDIGSGTGLCLFPLRDIGSQAIGIDVSQAAVAYCRSKGLDATLFDIENESADALAARGPFDAVIMADVLEHLMDPLAVLKDKVLPLLKPGGRVIATVPNFVFLRYRLEILTGQISHFNNDDSTGHDLPRPYNLGHKTMFSRNVLRETFKLAGFRNISVEPELLSESFNGFWSRPPFCNLRTGLKKMWPTMLAARFLVIAEKKS